MAEFILEASDSGKPLACKTKPLASRQGKLYFLDKNHFANCHFTKSNLARYFATHNAHSEKSKLIHNSAVLVGSIFVSLNDYYKPA